MWALRPMLLMLQALLCSGAFCNLPGMVDLIRAGLCQLVSESHAFCPLRRTSGALLGSRALGTGHSPSATPPTWCGSGTATRTARLRWLMSTPSSASLAHAPTRMWRPHPLRLSPHNPCPNSPCRWRGQSSTESFRSQRRMNSFWWLFAILHNFMLGSEAASPF